MKTKSGSQKERIGNLGKHLTQELSSRIQELITITLLATASENLALTKGESEKALKQRTAVKQQELKEKSQSSGTKLPLSIKLMQFNRFLLFALYLDKYGF